MHAYYHGMRVSQNFEVKNSSLLEKIAHMIREVAICSIKEIALCFEK